MILQCADDRWRDVAAAAEADHCAVTACRMRLEQREARAVEAEHRGAAAAAARAALRRESTDALAEGAQALLADATAHYARSAEVVAALRSERRAESCGADGAAARLDR